MEILRHPSGPGPDGIWFRGKDKGYRGQSRSFYKKIDRKNR